MENERLPGPDLSIGNLNSASLFWSFFFLGCASLQIILRFVDELILGLE